MAQKPNNIITRTDLTTYAFAIMQDEAKARELASILAPVVPTGTTTGRFNKFDTTAAFKNYLNARRSIGGQSSAIAFLSDTADFSAKPYGLRISVDQYERTQAGDAVTLLEQGKTRTLTLNCILSHLYAVVTAITDGVSAMAGKGVWSSANVDPIAELDAGIKAVWNNSGMVPNNCVIDFGAWLTLRNHPKVLARVGGADVATVTPERLTQMLAAPVKLTIADTALLTGGGLGNASATKTGALGSRALLFFNNPSATQYDPSFAKTFAPSAELFTEVYQYREEPHLDWYENNWTAQVQVVSSLLCSRIDVA